MQNDLRDLLKEIEEQLHVLHGAAAESSDSINGHENGNGGSVSVDDESIETGNADQQAPHRTSNIPFLKIDEIVPGSPASNAVSLFYFFWDVFSFCVTVILMHRFFMECDL